MGSGDSRAKIYGAFKKLDVDNDGLVGVRDLVDGYRQTYPEDTTHQLSSNEAQLILREIGLSLEQKTGIVGADRVETGVSFEDFWEYLQQHALLAEIMLDFQKSQQKGLSTTETEIERKNREEAGTRVLEVFISVVRPNILAIGGFPQEDSEVLIHKGRRGVELERKKELPMWSSRYWFGDADITWLKHLLAGGVAGAVSRTTVSPLERMKILFQVQGKGTGNYNGVINTLVKIWKEEGPKGYMRGNGTNVVRIVPYSAVQFATYEQFKRLLMEPGKSELDTKRRLTAGALAGIASVSATYPLDIVRTRISVQTGKLLEHAEKLPKDKRGRPVLPPMPGIYRTTINIYMNEGGIRAIFRGLGATLMGVAPYVALNFQCYEVLRKYFTPPGETSPNGMRKLACGALAGCVAQTVTYPLDVLRRKMQVASMAELGLQYKSTWDACKQVVRSEGFGGLYKGLVPNYLKVAPAIGVSFLTYELCNDFLKHV